MDYETGNWPDNFNNFSEEQLRKMKNEFGKKCKNYYIDKKSKRLFQIRKIQSIFEGKAYLINSLIFLADEANNIINLFHIELNHIGINLL